MLFKVFPIVLSIVVNCTDEAFNQTDKGCKGLHCAITDSIAPALAEETELDHPFTLEDRMAFYGVPGISIAVIDEGEIIWAEGFGRINSAGDRPVTDSTLFQAASISKPVTATVALQMVNEDLLDLDTDINEYLHSWKLLWNEQNPDNPVTLRHILSHTGGLNVHGFPGYPEDASLPELTDILDGRGLANTQNVKVQFPPGSTIQYSGGGYTIMQQMLMDITDSAFPDIMDDYLLSPVGMKNSSFDQQFPEIRGNATAHINGKPVAGVYHRYPEKAAAGLWTTPTDLANWVLTIQNSSNKNSDSPVDSVVVADMMTRQIAGFGLGPQIEGNDQSLRFRHAGSNHGYQADMIGYLHDGKGVVVMTNSDTSSHLIREVIHRIADYYNWRDYPELHQTGYQALPTEQLEQFTGTYHLSYQSGIDIEITLRDNHLYLEHPQAGLQPLFASGDNEFFAPFIHMNHIEFVGNNGRAEEMRIGRSDTQEVFERVDK